jgi:hypothetical protein
MMGKCRPDQEFIRIDPGLDESGGQARRGGADEGLHGCENGRQVRQVAGDQAAVKPLAFVV